MKFKAIAEQIQDYSVDWMCRKLGVSRAGYYVWAKRPESERVRKNALLSIEVKAAHKKSRGT